MKGLVLMAALLLVRECLCGFMQGRSGEQEARRRCDDELYEKVRN
jgi:hypothetical protein